MADSEIDELLFWVQMLPGVTPRPHNLPGFEYRGETLIYKIRFPVGTRWMLAVRFTFYDTVDLSLTAAKQMIAHNIGRRANSIRKG